MFIDVKHRERQSLFFSGQFVVVQHFFIMVSFFALEMVMYTLLLCVLEVCKLFFILIYIVGYREEIAKSIRSKFEIQNFKQCEDHERLWNINGEF